MKKILLIEDEKVLAEMYKEKLILAGFEVILSPESEEGLKLAKKEKPDLIILDILLPRANGIYFLTQLRKIKDPKVSSIPVIAFSNFDDPETKLQVKKFGVKDYLIKTNYTPQEIVEKVKDYFKQV